MHPLFCRALRTDSRTLDRILRFLLDFSEVREPPGVGKNWRGFAFRDQVLKLVAISLEREGCLWILCLALSFWSGGCSWTDKQSSTSGRRAPCGDVRNTNQLKGGLPGLGFTAQP